MKEAKSDTSLLPSFWYCKLNCVKAIFLIILTSDGGHDFYRAFQMRSLPGCKAFEPAENMICDSSDATLWDNISPWDILKTCFFECVFEWF